MIEVEIYAIRIGSTILIITDCGVQWLDIPPSENE